jgi:TolB-like protein/Tfp pilus assembly protein PilF
MSRRPSSLQALFAEMSRRHVFRVMAVYGVVGFILLQVVDLLVPALLLPDWTYRLVAVLLLLGLPVAVVLTWAFEQTPDGLKRTASAAPGEIEAIVAEPAHRRWPSGLLALAGIVLLFAGGWWLGQRSGASDAARGADGREAGGGAAAADTRSLAVLPFHTRVAGAAGETSDDEVVLFADGMHDDLLTQLFRIRELRVTSRTSVEEFRGTDRNLREIANTLGVDFVVEAAVDRIGERVRVNVQLIDADSDGHVWAETYDATMTLDNLFEIRDDLTRRIAASLRATLSPEVEAKLAARPTENAEAFELFTRGRHLFARGARPEVEQAIELFGRARDLDPGFAAAHAALAGAHLRMVDYGYVPRSRGVPQARAAVERALELEPDLAEALTHLAMIEGLEGDQASRRETLERVIELYPSDARAHSELGQLYRYLGYERRAVEELELARDLDPLAADIGVGLAWSLADAGRDREAVAQASALLELHPDFEPAATALAYGLLALGRHDEAIETLRQALRRDPSSIFANENLAWILRHTGRGDEALAQIDRAVELTPDDFPTWITRALLQWHAGELGEAAASAREVVRLAPGEGGPRVMLAFALLGVGDTASAVAHLDSASLVETRGTEFAGQGFFAAGRTEEAVTWSRSFADHEPESVERRTQHARLLFSTAPWAAHSAGDALREYGLALRQLGRTDESLPMFEALAASRPGSAEAASELGWELLVGQRDPAGAEREFRRALRGNPAHWRALWGMARIHATSGRADSALAAIRRAAELCPEPACHEYLEAQEGVLRAIGGPAAETRELLARHGQQRGGLVWNERLPVVAAAYAMSGEIDRAFQLLDVAYQNRSTELLNLKVEPIFDPLRGDPRFDALLRRLELE